VRDGEQSRSTITVKVDSPAQVWVQRQAMDLVGEWVSVGDPVMLPADGNTTIHLGRWASRPLEGPNVRLIIAERQ